ncbi:MAG: bifunctional 2-polyprenyl-6-hydroxyphenol methylase/3-demethylubiquinol 3-O-methyltransferase UbiG [Gammaproteobacteria bacterium]|nr:bifunctional 2-polyprenyl-6-hydroxyphenol methylase/3-demethylubiquinol 3-O-methyltransferase UbiG [Gammaproteobacteria bacterium]NND60276.1 bifunctional 2-polyprenyl-6-hydroxyphenol methylase/3-demethylubiquinol 3-O-methyltransferase UbiG [Gammaproteobacteria bacterium]
MTTNVDQGELSKFEQVASRWWDPAGEFGPLHAINPLRAGFIAERTTLDGARLIDIGCGGGLLCEAMARAGATVVGVDAGETAIAAATAHAQQGDLAIDYRCSTAETVAQREPAAFDVVTCLEMLEHVPDPSQVVAACAQLVRPGGDVFFSTINRNAKAWLMAVVGAEYVLKLLPQGTHDYSRFIRPSELLEWSRLAGLEVRDMTGMHYNPLTRVYSLGGNVDVNYLVHLQRPVLP